MLCVRKSKVYEYEGIEFALVEVPGHSYYYEAEKMAHENEDAEKIIKFSKNKKLQYQIKNNIKTKTNGGATWQNKNQKQRKRR